MPKDYPRKNRVSELIHRELGQIIVSDLGDPRLRFSTVTDVDVSPDLKHARIYISVMGSDDASEAVDALNHASGYLQHQLGPVLKLRTMPELRFFEDRSQIEGEKIERLLRESESKHGKT